eukprot:TRINITY_DN4480_c0_g1_i1.p2 TRINITY_DN4480_c0_g1~~TRINITY_DN4480_c0_g1_i1.p2  ORF type:complete len:156 (+),score=45.33 TRINITY_DN4480_c0_g1_i1:183-650(+)
MGKNKVMAVAFGRDETEEYQDNTAGLGQLLMKSGESGVLMTNRTQDDVEEFFETFSISDYARSGTIANATQTMQAGPIDGLAGSMEPQLRRLGLPTTLKNGVIVVERDYDLCVEGQVITAEQAKLLKQFEFKTVSFKLRLEGMWDKESQQFADLQ